MKAIFQEIKMAEVAKGAREMKFRIPKAVRNAVISIVVLLVVFVGGGVGYVWYSGQTAPELPVVATPVAVSPQSVIKPRKADPNAPVSASVQMLTSPVKPGDNASITIKTSPEAKCTIEVLYNEVASTDSGLQTKKADEFGIAIWTWTVEEAVPLGKWPITINCALGEKSAVVTGELEVK